MRNRCLCECVCLLCECACVCVCVKVSKAGVSMMTRILAKEYPQFRINCCCPGWCVTGV